jgi:hypothetical protein
MATVVDGVLVATKSYYWFLTFTMVYQIEPVVNLSKSFEGGILSLWNLT